MLFYNTVFYPVYTQFLKRVITFQVQDFTIVFDELSNICQPVSPAFIALPADSSTVLTNNNNKNIYFITINNKKKMFFPAENDKIA